MTLRNYPFLIASLAATLSALQAGETVEIDLAEVPPALLRAAQEAVQNARFTDADIETEDSGLRIYEVRGVQEKFAMESIAARPEQIKIEELDDDGFILPTRRVVLQNVEFEVDLFENGNIEEIERVIPAELVPPMVLKRIQTAYHGFEPTRTEASFNAFGKIFQYEFAGAYQGRSLDLEVSADGSKIATADE